VQRSTHTHRSAKISLYIQSLRSARAARASYTGLHLPEPLNRCRLTLCNVCYAARNSLQAIAGHSCIGLLPVLKCTHQVACRILYDNLFYQNANRTTNYLTSDTKCEQTRLCSFWEPTGPYQKAQSTRQHCNSGFGY